MSDKVVPLFAVNGLAPDPESAAAYLEHLAAQVRSGEMTIRKATVVVMDRDGMVSHYPFGEPATFVEMVGLLSFAQHLTMARFDPEPED